MDASGPKMVARGGAAPPGRALAPGRPDAHPGVVRIAGDLPDRARPEGLVLSGVAGAVDGIGYLLLHVFTAHVTGNTVHAGTRLGAGDLRDAGRTLLSIGLFAGGVALGAVVRERCERRGWDPRPVVLGLAAALLAAFALLGRGLVPGVSHDVTGWRALAALAAATFGIGSQNAVGPRVGGRPVRTYITGTTIEVVESLVAAANAAPAARRRELARSAALFLVWAAYLAGAVLSAVTCARLGSAAALLPAGALALVALRYGTAREG